MANRLEASPRRQPTRAEAHPGWYSLERYNTYGQTVNLDGQGRLLIPALLRETSGVGSEVLVLAQADYLKVVDRARHFAALASAPITDEDYDDLARAL